MRGLYYSDGHEVYAGSLALAVAAESESVSMIARADNLEFIGRPADAERFRETVRRGIENFRTLSGSNRSLGPMFELRKQLAPGNFDYFHIQQSSDPRFIGHAARMPTVLTLHESRYREGNNTTRTREARVQQIYRKLSDVLIVHTESCLEGLTPSELDKAVVIPHGVPVCRVQSSPPVSSKTILIFGRATGYKGFDVLRAAMREVWKSEPDATLRVLASRSDTGVEFHDPDPRVSTTWDGFSEADLDAALAGARAVCLPYTSVSGTGVGTRAYGAGKPIVASDLEGLRELVTSEELLVRPGDVQDLARALTEVLRGDYGAQPIDETKSWPAVARRHVETYTSLITASRRQRTGL